MSIPPNARDIRSSLLISGLKRARDQLLGTLRKSLTERQS
jgi:hypothetical protein